MSADRRNDRHEIEIPPSRGRIDRGIHDEISAHLEERTAELIALGVEPAAAAEQARREFGDLESTHRALKRIDERAALASWSANLLGDFGGDVRRTLRGLSRRPGFAAIAAATLALGIGANAAMFGLVDRLLLSPPRHVRDAASLVRLRFDQVNLGGSRITWVRTSVPAYQRLAAQPSGFAGVAGYAELPLTLTLGDEVEELRVLAVTPQYFSVLGTQPALGRFPSEGAEAADQRAIVISHSLWTRRFGGTADALGQPVRLGEDQFTIAGVAPRGFTGDDIEPIDAWISLGSSTPAMPAGWQVNANWRIVSVFARLGSGMTATQAAGQATRVYRAALTDSRVPDSTAAVELRSLAPGRDMTGAAVTPETRVALWLQGVALLVLLVALANVTNLLLLRAIERQRETAVRLALGISRLRLVRHLSLESLVLAAVGGTIGVMLARQLGPALWSLVLPDGAGAGMTADRLGGMAAAIAVGCAVIMTIVPAVMLRASTGTELLRSGTRGASRRSSAVGEGLVVLQVALTVVLIVGAGLFVLSIRRLGAIELGMAIDRVVGVRVNPGTGVRDQATREAIFTAAAEAIRRMPGVVEVGMAQSAPFLPSMNAPFFLPGRDDLPGVVPGGLGHPTFFAVTPEFLSTMGVPLLQGRGITTADQANSTRVMLVDATMAKTFWPGESALGRCVKIGADTMPCTTVVGVVGDSRRSLTHPQHSLRYYLPIGQSPYRPSQRYLFVRTARRAPAMVAQVHAAIKGAATAGAFADVFPMDRLLDPYTKQWRLGMAAFVAFGTLATLIATIGLYGVISFRVAFQEREFGIRRALGESTSCLLRSVITGAMGRSTIGLVTGGLLSLGLARRLRELLYQPSLVDATVFVAATAVVVIATVVASAAPSWRAARVDPIRVLRAE
jgi:predicted permease